MQLRLIKHLALQPLIDSQNGLASRMPTCESLPEAVLTCMLAPLGQFDGDILVKSPIDALNSNCSFQLSTDCLSTSSVCSNLRQQLFPGADSSFFNCGHCEYVAVTLTELPGGVLGSLATKSSRRGLIEVHLPLSQQGWFHRSQVVPCSSEQFIVRRRNQMVKASQGFQVKVANTGRISRCMQADGSMCVYAKRARSLQAWILHGSCARKRAQCSDVKQTMQGISGHCSGENFRKLLRKLCPTRKKAAPFVFEFEETALIPQVCAC